MKNIILLLSFLIPFLVTSQVSLDHGFVDSNYVLKSESSNDVDEDFQFLKSKNNKIIYCIVRDLKGVTTGEVLQWEVASSVLEEDFHTYHTVNGVGEHYMLTFSVEGDFVVVVNVKTRGYSTMTGKGLVISGL